jgi:hypothetical protein
MNWTADKRWSDTFLPQIKQILGLYLIGEPPIEEDAERNTDLIVLKMEPVRIACRVRKYYALNHWPDEFTIRECRPSGTKTELAKIIEGWGDYIFYGFSNELEDDLAAWTLGDLKVFRLWYVRTLALMNSKMLPGEKQKNHDNSSTFRSFVIDDLPKSFVVSRKFIQPKIENRHPQELFP